MANALVVTRLSPSGAFRELPLFDFLHSPRLPRAHHLYLLLDRRFAPEFVIFSISTIRRFSSS